MKDSRLSLQKLTDVINVEHLIPSVLSVLSVPEPVFVAEEPVAVAGDVAVVSVVVVVVAELLYSACFVYFSLCQPVKHRGGGTPGTH